MKKLIIFAAIAFFALLFVESCSTVPLTGRKQLSLLPESEMVSMGLTNYSAFLKENTVSTDKVNTALVNKVGANISKAVIKYMTDNNMQSRLDGYNWEFNLIKNDTTQNAWCMPGGKVVVYSGILPVTKDENGLAVVLSHEIAHAVARHGNERMSQQLVVQMGGVALSEAVKEKPAETQSIFNAAYGAGSQLGVMLPFSRKQELEADKLGLIFMAMAGYDPSTAVAFWERMSALGNSSTIELMSTHPSDARRIEQIKSSLPEIMKYYSGK
jgi:predicted Zn-dependent protease